MVYTALFLALALFSSILSVIAAPSFTDLVVFGDSYSDNGHPRDPKLKIIGTSNGPVWNDYLSKKLQANLSNFAILGATVDNQIVLRSAPCVKDQAQIFYKALTVNHAADAVTYNERSLFAIWIGVNDNYDLFFSGAAPSKYNDTIMALRGIMTGLYDHGARHFFIPNVPPIEATPLGFDRVKGNPVILELFGECIIRYNSLLEQAMREFVLQHPDANVQVFDAHSLFEQFHYSPQEFGLTNVTSACVNDFGKCAEPEKYLFWDYVHPTTYVHSLIADAFYNALSKESA
ncbi:uncharacterized protein VTP21DRAFT_11668 [Calcarisporiella thermophila]|uniref:uncharacterized protein n=1 Tax=Calcarisporiella thermophila TaxID=911321 RepID=UPI0037446387